MVARVEVDDAAAAAPASPTCATARALPARRRGRRRRLLDRDAAAAAQLDEPRASRTGSATTHDQVGRYVMVQGAPQVAGRFPESCGCTRRRRPRSRASSSTRPTARAASRAASRSRPSRRCRSAGPSTCSPTATGARALREYMRDYNHWTVLGALCELLPQPENRVTLADETRPPRDAGRAASTTRSATTTARTSPARSR